MLWILIWAGLFAGAVYWCKLIFDRRHRDVRRLKESTDRAEKGVIIFMWIITGVIFLWLLNFAWWIISRIFGGLLAFAG